MLSYLVGFLACLLFLYNPLSQGISQLPIFSGISPAAPQIRRTPRPRVNEDLLALDDWPANLTCPEDSYSVHLFSKEPLVIYIENFLAVEERSHLLEISEPVFEPSTITHNGGAATHRDQSVRDSEVAVIPRTDVVRCIEARARAFQGWRDDQWVERLRTQRYHPGGHYSHHFDWSSSYGGWGRVSSFMAWVDGSSDDKTSALVGGGTEFPLIEKWSLDERWCRFIVCDTEGESRLEVEGDTDGDDHASAAAKDRKATRGRSISGVVFKPRAGSAVYWENFRPDGTGRGWDETWHAGLPVVQGTKVGLNIWTWGRID